MSYIVPDELPKHCNKCPFGILNYSFPFEDFIDKSKVDGKYNQPYTHGYMCNLDYAMNARYTKIMRAKIHKNIRKPKWCPLKELKGDIE